MNIRNLFFLFFPFMAMSQNKFDAVRERLMQNNKYEYIYYFENNYAVFRTFDKKMGVIDSTENVIIKPVFSFIGIKKGLNNLFEVGNEINKKFKRGYIDIKGNIKIPIIYDDVFYVGKGLIRVTKDNKFGVVDTLNNVIIPIEFDYVLFDNDLFISKINGTNKLYGLNGKIISDLQFTQISRFRNNKAIISLPDKSNLIIDNFGNIVLAPINGYSFEMILNNDLYLIKSKLNAKKGILNAKGEFSIECKYEEIKQVRSYFMAKFNNKNGIISAADSVIKSFVYDQIYYSYFDDPGALEGINFGENCIVKKDGKFGVINPKIEKEIIPINYKSIRIVFNKYYIVENNENKNGLYLGNGEKILNEEYTFYHGFGNAIFATKDNKQYIINLENENYTEVELFVDAFAKPNEEDDCSINSNQVFELKGRFGVINNEGKMVIPSDYELIENICLSDEFIVMKNGKYGIVNAENKIIENIEYDEFQILKESIVFTNEKKTIRKYHDIKFNEEPPPILNFRY